MAKANQQRILRTGDEIVTSKNQTMRIHYLVEKDNQFSFESLLGNIKEILAVPKTGGAVMHVAPNQVCF